MMVVIEAELAKRRSELNGNADIRAIRLDIKFKDGTDQPRAVVVTVETETTLT